MSYFSFTNVTPPPNDELVNEITHLNNNWDHLDAKIAALQGHGSFTNQEVGQEVIVLNTGNLSLGVWNGSTWVFPSQPNSAWTTWTALPLTSSPIARPSFTPRYRVNTGLKVGELTGGLQVDGAASAWTASAIVTVTPTTTGVLGSTYTPGTRFYTGDCATSIPTSNVAGGQWMIDNANDGFRLRVRFMGTSGGGNFLQLNGIRWFW
jgi:hypothetical protein